MESYIFIWTCLTRACAHTVTPLHAGMTVFLNREDEVDITRSTARFKGDVFIVAAAEEKKSSPSLYGAH